MASNLYDYMRPTNKSAKNGFNGSSHQTFHAKVGQVIPVQCIETVPNSDYTIDIDAFTRTLPLNTAAFSRIRENYYICFVPYMQLWQSFNSTIVRRTDSQSAAYQYLSGFSPTISLGRLLKTLYQHKDDPDWVDQMGYRLCDGAIRLLDMLGYGYYGEMFRDDFISSEATSEDQATLANGIFDSLIDIRVNLWRILAYNKIWHSFFRDSLYDNDTVTLNLSNFQPQTANTNTAQMFNVDDVNVLSMANQDSESALENNYHLESVRQWSQIACLFQLRYQHWVHDDYTGLMPDTQFGAVSSVPLDVDGSVDIGGSLVPQGSAYRDLSMVEGSISGSGNVGVSGSDTFDLGAVNVYSAQGQQENNGVWVAQQGGSLGSVSFGSSPGMSVSSNPFRFKGSTVPGETPVLASSVASKLGVSASDVASALTVSGSEAHLTSADILSLIKFEASSGGSIDFTGAGFNVLELVEAQAIQKWRQRAMLAGNRMRDNWRAHFGVNPNYDMETMPEMIGSVDNQISIQEVVSTADTAPDGQTNLGDIAGKGYGASDQKKFKFHANDYGVIMVLYCAVPVAQQLSYGLDRANQLNEWSDYYQSEFQNIGLEAVTNLNYSSINGEVFVDHQGVASPEFTPDSAMVNFGFAPYQYQLKSYRSKVHGLFNVGFPGVDRDFNSWVTSRVDMMEVPFTVDVNHQGSWFVSSGGFRAVLTLRNRYINPAVMNSIFVQAADSTEVTDHLMVNADVNVKMVLPLSKVGMPQF